MGINVKKLSNWFMGVPYLISLQNIFYSNIITADRYLDHPVSCSNKFEYQHFNDTAADQGINWLIVSPINDTTTSTCIANTCHGHSIRITQRNFVIFWHCDRQRKRKVKYKNPADVTIVTTMKTDYCISRLDPSSTLHRFVVIFLAFMAFILMLWPICNNEEMTFSWFLLMGKLFV